MSKLRTFKLHRDNVRKLIFSAVAGMITAFCYVAGYQLDRFDSLTLTDPGFYLTWLLSSVLAAAVLFLLWFGIDKLSGKYSPRKEAPVSPLADLGCTFFLFLCWLPTLLSIFPGVFSYDAYNEWEQVYNGLLTSHHPVVHVLLAGGLTEGLYLLTGNYNLGIAFYSLLQMFVLAGCFTFVIRFLRRRGIPRTARILTLLFFAVSPVVQLFSICATKDVFFTGAELIFFLYILEFSIDSSFAGNRKQMVYFALSALCTMVFRNNGLYIVLFMLLILVLTGRKVLLKYKKNVLLFCAVLFLPYFLYTGPLYRALDVAPGGVEEMLSVPLQQMARVYHYDAASLSPEDLELLYSYVEKDSLDGYRATVSDFVKKGFQRETFQQDKLSFFKLWAKLGMEHPLTYINSFLINTVDGWYPHAVIDGYRHVDGRGSWFDYRVAPPGEEKVYLQGLHEFYDALSHDLSVQEKPFVFLWISPGWYFLCTLILFFYFWSRKYNHLQRPMFVFVIHFLTLLLGPMMLVRYMLLFFFALPVLICMALFRKNFARKDEFNETCHS